jgi:hypothetical protein
MCFSEIEDDIQEECEKYGEVEKCVLCKSGPEKCKVSIFLTQESITS